MTNPVSGTWAKANITTSGSVYIDPTYQNIYVQEVAKGWTQADVDWVMKELADPGYLEDAEVEASPEMLQEIAEKKAAEMILDAPAAAAMAMHQDPFEAAKKLRVKIRRLRELHSTYNLIHQPSGGETTVGYKIASAQSRYHRSEAYDASVDRYLEKLENGIKYGRPEQRRAALENLKSALKSQRNLDASGKEYLHEAAKAVNQEAAPATLNNEVPGLIKDIHRFAQAIPLSGDIPLTPADHVLRAMAMILINAGYAKKG